jgi:hypothetical protein
VLGFAREMFYHWVNEARGLFLPACFSGAKDVRLRALKTLGEIEVEALLW